MSFARGCVPPAPPSLLGLALVSPYDLFLLQGHLSGDLVATLIQSDLVSRSVLTRARFQIRSHSQVAGARTLDIPLWATGQPPTPCKAMYSQVLETRAWAHPGRGSTLPTTTRFLFFAKFLLKFYRRRKKMQFPCCNYDLIFGLSILPTQ